VKIHIEVEGGLPEDEVVIRCGRVDDTIQKIHQLHTRADGFARQDNLLQGQ
jgi:hypothetical protein